MISRTPCTECVQASGRGGWTLVELMTAIVISGIVLLGLARLFTTTLDHYSMQTRISDLHQNTQYTVRYLSDMVMQLGGDMPDSGLAVFEQNSVGDDSLAARVNPSGGVQYFAGHISSSRSLAVDDARGFIDREGRSLTLVKKPYDRRVAVELLYIDESYGAGDFSAGVDTINDSIRLDRPTAFARNDALFGFVVENHYLKDGMLYRDDNVIAESIDSLAITFFDSTGVNTTTEWDEARHAEVCVRGITSSPIRGFTDPDYNDGYKRLTLRMKFRLRNKV